MKNTRKLLSLLLVFALAFTFSLPTFAHDEPASPYGKDVLQEVTENLAGFGVRINGSENLKAAATYIKDNLSQYDNFNVEMAEIPLNANATALYRNYTSLYAAVDLDPGTATGYVPQLYGRAYPNNATFNDAGNFTGTFCDFGTNTDFTVPDVTSGGIYGTVRFTATPTQALITSFVNAVEAKYTGNVKVTGLYISRDSAATGTAAFTPPNISGLTFPTATFSLVDLERIKAAGEAGKIRSTTWINVGTLYGVYATKPAATDNPDLVIVFYGHLDTVWASPGVNDNGSGAIAILELARRFNDMDLGNVELILATGDGEEYTNMEGSCYIASKLVREGKAPITFNFNMDMIAPAYDAKTSAGAALNFVEFSTKSGSQSVGGTWNSQYNMAAYFAMADAWNVDRPGVITTVRTQNSTGASDYEIFHYLGMEAISMHHGLEYGYHTAIDNINDNYSQVRHLYSVDLMTAAVEKIVASEFTKKAAFETETINGVTELSLANADRLFKTFDRVSTTVTGTGGSRNIVFTADDPAVTLPQGSYTVTAATGTVRGAVSYPANTQQDFTGKLVPATDEVFVGANVSVNEESGIEGDIDYTFSLSGARDLLNIRLEFVVDGSMLAGKGLEALNGFTAVDGIDWHFIGGNSWLGDVTIGYPAGDGTGFTSEDPVDVATFTFAPRAKGDSAFTIVGFKAVGLRDDETCYLDARIENGEAVTNIDQRIFSKYDLNRDNKVDALDLGVMLLYCGFNTATPGWDSLVKVNDSRGKGVTASMCDVNNDGIIDMLDLLDLFIHYTK
ncbi:MAG: M28 family peptidase [Clostridiales bacterium]|nr:M28 family peptidase [Clostridiales bacterium]